MEKQGRFAKMGYHYVWDVSGVSAELVEKTEDIQTFLSEVTQRFNLTEIQSHYHQFSPHGATGIVLLAESHLSIHTWPENGYFALDLFSCKAIEDINHMSSLIEKYFQPESIEGNVVTRGYREPIPQAL